MRKFTTTYYKLSSNGKFLEGNGFRLAFISDLHNMEFGPDNTVLKAVIDEAAPDLVIIGGDQIVAKPGENLDPGLSFAERLAEEYQVIYGCGNHEYRLKLYPEQYGDLYNLEATPAESTAYRLAKHDRAKWPDIKTAGHEGDTPYYTNSSHLPVDYTEDIFSALDIQDDLQTLYTSGTVFHAFLGEKLPDWKAAASLVRKIAENYKLPYYTLSPTYSVCANDGYLAGEHFTCPICGKEAEVYSRITGYYRPVKNWNDGKRQEYKNRTVYDIIHSKSPEQKMKSYGAAEKLAEQAAGKEEPKAAAAADKIEEDGMYLFTTSTCPNCKMAKEMLAEEQYEVIDAERHPDLAAQYGIMQAPTLLVVEDGQAQKIVNASNIQKYVDEYLS